MISENTAIMTKNLLWPPQVEMKTFVIQHLGDGDLVLGLQDAIVDLLKKRLLGENACEKKSSLIQVCFLKRALYPVDGVNDPVARPNVGLHHLGLDPTTVNLVVDDEYDTVGDGGQQD